jgi:hypothetical protein
MYQYNENGAVIRIADNTLIGNPDTDGDFQVWTAEGNTPADHVPLVLTYEQRRLTEYPSVGDQLDALWKGGQAQADMKVVIDAVKANHPKP